MDKRARKYFYQFHWPLLGVLLAIMTMALINLYSASLNQIGELSGHFQSQLIWFVLSLFVIGILTCLSDRFFEQISYHVYGVSLLLLLAVVFFGSQKSGQQNWLVFGPLNLQPAEFAKLALVLVLSKELCRLKDRKELYGVSFLRVFAFILLPLILILIQRDVGNSLFFIAIGMSLLLFYGIRRRLILTFVFVGLLGAGLSYQYFLKPYQKNRILAFLNPEKDPLRSGYHLVQSKIAVGSGQFLGKGYKKGSLNKLRFLPEKHTDFIFPVLAEEWGFLGSFIVLALYFTFLMMLLSASSRARDQYGSYVLFGITALFFWQILINIGGVLGLMPLTGVPFPFLSYGGSSVLSLSIAMGIAFSIHMRRYVF